jgi:undecaprenyl-diphosphatase
MHDSDLSILWFFNRTIASETLDPIMVGLTSVWWWMPLYILGAAYLIWKYKWRGVRLVLGALLVVLFTDQLTQLVIKPLFGRLRPCEMLATGQHAVSWIRLPDGPRLGFGFPSSHAINNFAVATFFATVLNHNRYARFLFIAALLISISRVYLGLHYPSDIVGGAVMGILIGMGFAGLIEYLEERMNRKKHPVPTAAEIAASPAGKRQIQNSPWNKVAEATDGSETNEIETEKL